MCYTNGFETTMQLYSELHRVLRPGGRLLTISLHTEDEVMPFGCRNPRCSFVASSCTLRSERKDGFFHCFCVFDKTSGLSTGMKSVLASLHPLTFVNRDGQVAGLQNLDSQGLRWDPRNGLFESASEGDLLVTFDKVLEDMSVSDFNC